MNKPRFIMVGGFLGAGKTTTVLKLANWLSSTRKLRVGIITNDQADGLVDTTLSRNSSFPTRQIAGGCFCCKSDALIEATEALSEEARPDVFIAEPVGSCTDLVATVTLPLVNIYRKDFLVAPVTVLMDPFRGERIVSLQAPPQTKDAPRSFSDDVHYIYLKQLEEAEFIVINKIDVCPKPQLERLRGSLSDRFPESRVISVSARTGEGMDEYFNLLADHTSQVTKLMQIDYERYGAGEAQLGWLNASFSVHTTSLQSCDGNRLLLDIAARLRECFLSAGKEVAHFKASLEDSIQREASLAVVQWVSTDRLPEITVRLARSFRQGRLTLNMRAEAEPEFLHQAMNEILGSFANTLRLTTEKIDYFRPGQPNPTHRIALLPQPVG